MRSNSLNQHLPAGDIKFKFVKGDHVWVRIQRWGHPAKEVPAEILFNVVERKTEYCEQHTTVRYLEIQSECRYACVPISWLRKFSKKDEELLQSNSL